MIYIFMLIAHLFGVHSPPPYTIKEDNVGENEFRCTICRKVFEKED